MFPYYKPPVTFVQTTLGEINPEGAGQPRLVLDLAVYPSSGSG
jgi:hypothetical protein